MHRSDVALDVECGMWMDEKFCGKKKPKEKTENEKMKEIFKYVSGF